MDIINYRPLDIHLKTAKLSKLILSNKKKFYFTSVFKKCFRL